MKIRYKVLYVVKNQTPKHKEYEVDSAETLLKLIGLDLGNYPKDVVVSIVPVHEDFHKYIIS